MKAIMAIVSELEKTTGANIHVDVDGDVYTISVYSKKTMYAIMCDGEDDCYNTLSAMLDGAKLVIDIKTGEAGFES